VKSINRALEQKARDLAGLKGYVTNLAACPDGTPVTAIFAFPMFVFLPYRVLPHCANMKMPAPLPA
jgi:hypothetical protein